MKIHPRQFSAFSSYLPLSLTLGEKKHLGLRKIFAQCLSYLPNKESAQLLPLSKEQQTLTFISSYTINAFRAHAWLEDTIIISRF